MNKPLVVKSIVALTGTGVVVGGTVLGASYSQKNKKIDDIPTKEFLEKRKKHRVSSLKAVFLKHQQDKDAIATFIHGSNIRADTIFFIENGEFKLPDDVNTELTSWCERDTETSLDLAKYPELVKEKICNPK